MTELLPCPFCGSTNVRLSDGLPGLLAARHAVGVSCWDCGHHGSCVEWSLLDAQVKQGWDGRRALRERWNRAAAYAKGAG